MQLKRQDNVNYVAIGDNTVDTTAPTGTLAVSANLTNGDVVLVDEGNNILTSGLYNALAADRKVRVAQVISLANQEFIFSPAMTKSSITTSVSGYTAAAPQITVIGYNGTTGSLPNPTSDANFWIKVRKNDNDAANRSQPASLFSGPVTATGSGGQGPLAEALVKNGNKNMEDEPANNYLQYGLLCDEAGTSLTATTGNLSIAIGSKILTASVAIDGEMAVGDFIRLSEDASTAAATTDPVYKIISMDTTAETAVLDRPYDGDVAYSATAPGTVADFVTAAAFASAECGVRLKGKVAPFDVDAFRNYYTNRFTATFSDTSTLNSHITGANDGNGVWQQVAMDEYMSMGNQGQNEQLAVPPKTRTKTYVEGGEYSSLLIESNEEIQGLTAYNKERATVLVYGQRTSGGVITNTPADHLAAALGATLVP